MQSPMEEFANTSQECIDKVAPVLQCAEEVARKLKFKAADTLQKIRKELERDRFTVMFFGRFKSGKSTILNALLGKPSTTIPGLKPGLGPMPVDINPATAVPTRIYYADQPEVFAIKRGQREAWDFETYIKQSKQKSSKEETDLFFRDIEGFEVGYPSRFLIGGVDLIDTPGTDDNDKMDQQVFEAAMSADATILALSHPATMGMGEEKYLQKLMATGMLSGLIIVNARDPDPPYELAVPPSEETIKVIWNRVVMTLKKCPPYNGQTLESADVFFLNALQTFKGRMNENHQAVAASGIIPFETRLVEYLQFERRIVHLQRYLGAADPILVSMEQLISKQCYGLEERQQSSQVKIADLERRLAEIPKRMPNFPKIIKRACQDAQRSVQDSIEELYRDIECSLPEHMAHQSLPSLHKEGYWERLKASANATWEQKQLVQEALNIALQFIESRVDQWREAPANENGVSRSLNIPITDMVEELRAEATVIEQQYAQIQFELTGWKDSDISTKLQTASFGAQVTAATVDALDIQLDCSGIGYAGEKRALGRLALGSLSVGIPGLIVHMALPVLLPVTIAYGIAFSILTGMDSMERKIKDNVVTVLLKGSEGNPKEGIPPFGGLANEPRRQREKIASFVRKHFVEIEARVIQIVNDHIQMEEQSLRNQLEELNRTATERKHKLMELNGYATQVQRCRVELKEVWASVSEPGARHSNQPAQV